MKKVMVILVLVALLFGTIPVSASDGNGGPDRSVVVRIIEIDYDLNRIEVQECLYFSGCYSYWLVVTDSVKFLGVSTSEDFGFEDLQIDQWVKIEFYWDGGRIVVSKIYVR